MQQAKNDLPVWTAAKLQKKPAFSTVNVNGDVSV